jgi:hypothetical protein
MGDIENAKAFKNMHDIAISHGYKQSSTSPSLMHHPMGHTLLVSTSGKWQHHGSSGGMQAGISAGSLKQHLAKVHK